MALVTGARIGLITYTLGTDPRPGRLQHNAERNLLESSLVIGGQGTSALRPTAGKGKALYWNTDRSILQWDTGTGWEDVSTNGGGGPPAPVVAAGTAAEGVSARGARADHVHVLPLATTTTPGGMSAADKAKLDGAVVTATINTLMIRDANGRSQVASPAGSADVATKGYVDSIVGGAAAPVVSSTENGLATPTMLAATNRVSEGVAIATPDTMAVRDAAGRSQFAEPAAAGDAASKGYVDGQISSHRHAGEHITTGTIAAARLPVVTAAANGAMSTADKVKLDAATPSATNSTVAMRDESGRIQVGAPSVAADATTKGYVDTGLSGKAATSHTHMAADIVSGTMSTARLPYANTTNATDGIITATQLSMITSHNHDAAAINTGTLSTARLPVASSTSSGIISATTYSTIYSHSHAWADITSKPSTFPPSSHSHADLDNATYTVVPGALVRRWNDANNGSSDGTIHVPTPAAPGDAANKGYVDGKTWDGTDITSGVLPYGRVWGSTHAYNTQWNGLASNPARDVWVTSGGELCFNSSTKRHKTNIRPWEKDPRDLLDPVPSIYNRFDVPTGTVGVEEVGVIAEQAGEKVPEFVEWGPDTTESTEWRVQGWNYKNWTAAHQLLHRWHAGRDDHQDRRLARIEEALGLAPLAEGE